MIKFLAFLFLLSLSVSTFAKTRKVMNEVDRDILFEQKEASSITPSDISKEPEIYLDSESLFRDEDSSAGIYTDLYYTKNDSLRISFAYHVSQDYEEFSKLQVLDFQIHKKIPSYKDQWWGIQLKRVVGKYSAFADELTSDSGHPNADANTKRFDNEQSMSMFGFGYGQRFRLLGDLINSDKVFESLMAFANYVYLLDSTNSNKYEGYGLTAEYGLQRRISKGFFAGVKLGYNLASVVRPATTDEKKEDRSLVMKWTSLGFEFGYYF